MDEKMQRSVKRGPLVRAGRSWQLWTLGATSIVLSLASGWTTWDGMRNFTDGNILSLLVTIGIQGVLLVLAWFIGARLAEGFAAGGRLDEGQQETGRLSTLMRFFEVAIVVGLILLLVNFFAANFADLPVPLLEDLRGSPINSVVVWGGLALLVILVMVRSGQALVGGSVLTAQIMMRQAIPVVMLATCIFASVFFSFDSLFSNILPSDERSRIAELRSKTETASIISEISDTTTRTYLGELESLLQGRDWQAYKGRLDDLGKVLARLPGQAEAYVAEQERSRLAQTSQRRSEREKIANTRRDVDQRRSRAAELLAQRQGRSQAIRNEIADYTKRIDELDRAIVLKLAQMDAEEKGIGETAVAGRGPKYRALSAELDRLRAQKQNLELSQSSFRKQLAENDQRVAKFARAKLALDNELRQLDVSSKLVAKGTPEDAKVDAAGRLEEVAPQLISKLAVARRAFEQAPDRDRLGALAAQCTEAAAATTGTPFEFAPFDSGQCSAASVQAAAARVFVLDRGQRALGERCVGNNAAVLDGGLEAQLAYARDCMKVSELLSAQTAPIARRINDLERERDDKAHRFVVTSNAFLDGNKLAYLALAIALAIDGLILASGILGALTVRSPLAGLRRPDALSVADCEALIESALLPDVAFNARKMLEVIAPGLVGMHAEPGWSHRVSSDNVAWRAPRSNLQRLLNSGMAIGAVKSIPGRAHEYFVHGGLVAFLATLARTPSQRDVEQERLSELADMCIKVLGPDVAAKADRILRYVQVSSDVEGYSSAVRLADVAEEDRDVVRRCFNAAAAFDCVRRVGESDDTVRLLMRPMLYSLLVEFALETHEDKPQDSTATLRYGPTPALEASGTARAAVAPPDADAVVVAAPTGERRPRPARVVGQPDVEPPVEAAPSDGQSRSAGSGGRERSNNSPATSTR